VKGVNRLLILVALCVGLNGAAVAAWERIDAGTLASLRSVYFLDGKRGWIVGSRGTFLTSVDAGRSWKLEKPFTADTIVDVHFVDADSGWLLCERDVYSSGKNALSYLRRTSDGGKTWTNVDLDSGRDRLVRLAFTKDGYGYAFGEGGSIWQMLDDRLNWKRTQLPVKFLIRGGWFVDSFNGVLVGGSGTALFTSDAGVEWTLGSGDKPVESKLNDVVFIDSKRGWAVGADGTILSTLNGGRLWKVHESTVKDELLGICVTGSGFGVAVGDRGRILESAAPGANWIAVESGVKARLHDVAGTSDAIVAVGFGGAILVRK
jgi:photosystem II stability/assembly factor-like uncharacterized protein